MRVKNESAVGNLMLGRGRWGGAHRNLHGLADARRSNNSQKVMDPFEELENKNLKKQKNKLNTELFDLW